MSRIRSMKPVLNEKGELVQTITTQSKTGQTIKKYYHYYRGATTGPHTEYIPMESKPRATVIRKPVFEVVSDDTGESRRLTKRQAKKAYSARQVRKALKKLPRELKYRLKTLRRNSRDDRRYHEAPTSVEEAMEDFELPESAKPNIEYNLGEESPEASIPEGTKAVELDVDTESEE